MDDLKRNFESANILPDSRQRVPTNVMRGAGMNWVPIFCASCHVVPCGYVPEENMNFVCWLCTPCAEKYGEIADTWFMPDEIFWARLAQEQMDKYQRLLTNEELLKVLDDTSTPLKTLIREGT